jgi:hypothetical protein
MSTNYQIKMRVNTTLNAKTGCLEWNKYRLPGGYGRTRYEGRNMLAHRVAWLVAGGEIPEGMCVCHHCDNPACCNPEHMFLGTHKENTEDARSKGRLNVPRPNQTQRVRKFTHEQIDAIRSEEGLLGAIALKYGCTPAYVSMLRRGLRKTAPRRMEVVHG